MLSERILDRICAFAQIEIPAIRPAAPFFIPEQHFYTMTLSFLGGVDGVVDYFELIVIFWR